MKNKKRFIKSTLISLGLAVPLISTASALVSCNSKKEENKQPATPQIQLDEKHYYLPDLVNFLSPTNDNTLIIPEGIQYISTKMDGNNTKPPIEIVNKFNNVKDIILPLTLKELYFNVGYDNNLMNNLENVFWEKSGQYVRSSVNILESFEFISKSTNLTNLFLPIVKYHMRIEIIDKAIYNPDGSIDSLNLNEQNFNCLWADKTKSLPTKGTIEIMGIHLDYENLIIRSNNIKKYIFRENGKNTLYSDLNLSPISSTKEKPITLNASIPNDNKWPAPTYYAPLSIARSQVLNAGDIHVNFGENCQIRKFDMNKSFVWDDKRPGLDFYIRKNIFIDFSNCVDMTKQEYIDIWTHGINRDTPPGQTRLAGQLPRWTRAELLDTNDPHMIPPKHLAVECSNEKMCDLFQIN